MKTKVDSIGIKTKSDSTKHQSIETQDTTDLTTKQTSIGIKTKVDSNTSNTNLGNRTKPDSTPQTIEMQTGKIDSTAEDALTSVKKPAKQTGSVKSESIQEKVMDETNQVNYSLPKHFSFFLCTFHLNTHFL